MSWLRAFAAVFVLSTSVWGLQSDCSANTDAFDCNSVDQEDEGFVPKVDPSLNDFEQDDPRLIKVLKERYLFPPSNEPYNFSVKTGLNFKGQYGQATAVDAMLGNRFRSGFFIEAGAADGEKYSNSLLFELKYQWTGLLVEPDPKQFEDLLAKHRRAWSLPHCFSTKRRPEIVDFDSAWLFGGIINPTKKRKPGDGVVGYVQQQYGSIVGHPHLHNRRTIQVQCFPVYSVLLALGNPTVHYFTLDIEGAELQVLQTIPWENVDIKILDIEMNHVGEIFDGKQDDIRKLLEKAGYELQKKVEIDEIWVKKGFEVKK